MNCDVTNINQSFILKSALRESVVTQLGPSLCLEISSLREIANYFLVGSDRTEVIQTRPCLSDLSSLVNLHIVQCLLLTLEVNTTASSHQANISTVFTSEWSSGGVGGVGSVGSVL